LTSKFDQVVTQSFYEPNTSTRSFICIIVIACKAGVLLGE